MKTAIEKYVQVQHEDITELAKQIWESEGRQAGRDLEYWLRAERQLRSSRDSDSNLPPRQSTTDPVQSQVAGKAIRLPDSVTKFVQTK